MRLDREPGDLPSSQLSSTKQSISTDKKEVTIEDSMAVISGLISEIQASDEQLCQLPTVCQDHPKHPSRKTGQIRISLAQKSKSGNSSLTFLPLLRQFFHVLLTAGTTTILPACNDSIHHSSRNIFLAPLEDQLKQDLNSVQCFLHSYTLARQQQEQLNNFILKPPYSISFHNPYQE
jgi:hypothetical protein